MHYAPALIFCIVVTPPLLASEYGQWIASSEHMHKKSFELPISLAKNRAENNLGLAGGKFSIEYYVVEGESGYLVYLDPIYPPGSDGKQLIISDDEWCIYINGQNKIEDAEQCLSP